MGCSFKTGAYVSSKDAQNNIRIVKKQGIDRTCPLAVLEMTTANSSLMLKITAFSSMVPIENVFTAVSRTACIIWPWDNSANKSCKEDHCSHNEAANSNEICGDGPKVPSEKYQDRGPGGIYPCIPAETSAWTLTQSADTKP
jgi:hypothetical protein